MSTRSLGALASIVPLLAISGVPATADAEERSAVEEVLDDVGLFKSTIDVDSLDRGESSLQDPPSKVLEDDEDRDAEEDERRGEPFVAPIPFRSPTLGWGGALAGGYIFRIDPDDRDSPASTVALAGFGAENKSFGGVVTGRFHVAEDLWRVTSAVAVARVNYDFFGVGSGAGDRGDKIEIEADIVTGRLEVLRRLPHAIQVLGVPLYVGPSFGGSRTENSLGGGSLPPGVSASELDETRIHYGIPRPERRWSRHPRESIAAPCPGGWGPAGR